MKPTSTIKIFFCSFLILVTSPLLKAGVNGIGVTLLSYTLDTSNQVNLGYTITISAQVTNFDTVPFSGVLNFGLHNGEEVLTNTNIFDKPPYSGNTISLGPSETVPAIFSVNINHPYFRPGPDVVVVWPICTQPIADSIIIHLDILDPNGITDQKEIPLAYSIINNNILIKSSNSELDFQQVRIYNSMGQQISVLSSNFISTIPLPPLSTGIYFCQLIASDGRKFTIKFIGSGSN